MVLPTLALEVFMPNWSYSRVLLYPLFALTLSFNLISCGTSPDKPKGQKETSSQASAKALLERARLAPSPEREKLILMAAERYLQTGKTESARGLLIEMDSDKLTDEAYVKHTDLLAGIALDEGSVLLAHSILTKPRLEQQWQLMEPDMEISLREKRALSFEQVGEHELGVSERILLSSMLSDKKLEEENLNSLWRTLMGINLGRLAQLGSSTPGET
jgi:outer membrane PBP1 activator LpoA protein